MYIIVGLGNPGKKYEYTRHNCGFAAIDFLAKRCGVSITRSRFSALTAVTCLGGENVLLMKPQTFMNLSGTALAAAARFYKIPPEKVVVIYDDASLHCGDIRVRANGSAGGHNGIKSIIEQLETQDFPRVKIGIGAHGQTPLMDYVLSRPTSAEQKLITSRLPDVADACELLAQGKLSHAQEVYNARHGAEEEKQ